MAYLGVKPRLGDVRRERVGVGGLADGSEIALSVVCVSGSRPGPTPYLQASNHGNELTGVKVCRQVVAALRPDEVCGSVVAVLIGNVPAFRNRSRSFVEAERGPVDINRVFPGNREGLLTERTAYLSVEELLKRCDYAIDFHSALQGCTIAPFSYVCVDKSHHRRDRQVSIDRAFAPNLIYHQEESPSFGHTNLSQSFLSIAGELGGPTVITEMGKSNRIGWDLVDGCVAGARRALQAIGSLDVDDTPGDRNEARAGFRRLALVHTERGGLVRFGVEPHVAGGQPLAVVIDPLTSAEWVAESPVPGIPLRQLVMGSCSTGAELAWVAHDLVG